MAAQKKNIRDVFGVDYLLGPEPAATPAAQQASEPKGLIENARQLRQMGRVLEKLRADPNRRNRLHSLVDLTDLSLPVLLQVSDELEKNRLIRVIERDKFGNYLIEMTPDGNTFLENLS